MNLEIRHETRYRYSLPVSISHHLLHLVPRETPFQRCLSSRLEIPDAPASLEADTDYFGNAVTYITIQRRHLELRLQARSLVATLPRPLPSTSPPWETVARMAAAAAGEDALAALEMALPSRATPPIEAIADYARAAFAPGRPVLEGAVNLMGRIYADFTYRSGSTEVATPIAQSFSNRRGVCQDFAHIALSGLRSLGLPARYVSGYILTRPPPGRPRLVGADASHAWIAVWDGTGWVDLDPTNNQVVGEKHATLGWGRDYHDVSPVSGIIYGGGRHKVEVAVDVIDREAEALPATAAPP